MRDDSLLLSDDASGMIYRITYDGATGQATPFVPQPCPMLDQAARGTNVPLAMATRDQPLAAAAGHVIATGNLVGTFGEPK